MHLENPNKTPLKDMSEEEQAAIFKLWVKGEVEYYQPYFDLYNPADTIFIEGIYRAKPVELIPDSLDWSHVSDEFICMVRFNEDSSAFLATAYPCMDKDAEGYYFSPSQTDVITHPARIFASYKRGTVDWKDSLIKRPE